MCGIFGVISVDVPMGAAENEDRLVRVNNAIKHRGPDDYGIYQSHCGMAALTHRRLSILDLSAAARQPMVRRVGGEPEALTFNGEIYNYQELKTRLTEASFSTRSDTEVLLEGLSARGSSFINELDGMFAFGFWSPSRSEMLIATDPAGKKPIYTYWNGNIFAFASEIKAFKAYGLHLGEPDPERLKEYLVFGAVPWPYTIYRNVRRLPAGHFQRIHTRRGPSAPEKYWDLKFDSKTPVISYEDAQHELDRLLRDAVRKRLVSDVPIGCFLSGGLDSSIVSLLACDVLKETGGEGLRTFAVGFERGGGSSYDYDESRYSRYVSAKIGSEHKELRVSAADIDAEKIIRQFDEPFADSSSLPTYLLCRETRKHVTVALSGDGGDELFGGYLRFQATMLSSKPGVTTALRLLCAPIRANQANPRSTLGYLNRIRLALSRPPVERFLRWNSFFYEEELSAFLHEAADGILARLTSGIAGLDSIDLGRQLIYLNFKYYLFDDLLPKVDRMSMATSLEVRSPFLDKKLIEFAWSLPTHYKFSSFSGKRILKDMYRARLGSYIVDRKKRGFALPIEDFAANRLETIRPEHFSVMRKVFPRAELGDFFSDQTRPIRARPEKRYLLWSAEENLRA